MSVIKYLIKYILLKNKYKMIKKMTNFHVWLANCQNQTNHFIFCYVFKNQLCFHSYLCVGLKMSTVLQVATISYTLLVPNIMHANIANFNQIICYNLKTRIYLVKKLWSTNNKNYQYWHKYNSFYIRNIRELSLKI